MWRAKTDTFNTFNIKNNLGFKYAHMALMAMSYTVIKDKRIFFRFQYVEDKIEIFRILRNNLQQTTPFAEKIPINILNFCSP